MTDDPPTPPGVREAIDTLLTTDARDVGCEQTWQHIHRWCDLLLAGEVPARQMPGVAAHLRDCGPCAYDLQGLIDLVLAEGDR